MRTTGGVAEWLKAADCKSAGLTPYEGSNPSPTTRCIGRDWGVCGVEREQRSEAHAGVAQLVERKPSKLDVAGSSPVSRSRACE